MNDGDELFMLCVTNFSNTWIKNLPDLSEICFSKKGNLHSILVAIQHVYWKCDCSQHGNSCAEALAISPALFLIG